MKKILTVALALLFVGAAMAAPSRGPERDAAVREILQGTTAKEAMWTQDTSLWISVIDDGTRRDGYAQYACQVARDHHVTGSITVHVWDAVAMNAGKQRELGKAFCR